MGLINRVSAKAVKASAALKRVAADKLSQLRQVDEHSTNLLSGYRNETLVGIRIFPIVEVQKESGKFTEYGPSPFLQKSQLQKAMSSDRISVDFTTASGSYFTNRAEIEVPIYDQELEEIADSDLDSFVEKKSMLGEDVVQLAMEYEVSSILSDVNQYASGYTVTLAGSTQWKQTTSTPLTDLRTAVRKIALANGKSYKQLGIAFTPKAWEAISDHAQIQAKIQYGAGPANPSVVTEKALADVFGVGRVDILAAQYPITLDPQDPTATVFDFLWGDVVLVYVINEKPNISTPLPGAIVRKVGYPWVSEYRWEKKDCIYKVVRDNWGVMVRKASGGLNRVYLIKNASGL